MDEVIQKVDEIKEAQEKKVEDENWNEIINSARKVIEVPQNFSFKPKAKSKRDLFRLEGVKPMVINFDHVSHIALDGKNLIFAFYTNSLSFELVDEAAAKAVFEQLLNIWSGEIQE